MLKYICYNYIVVIVGTYSITAVQHVAEGMFSLLFRLRPYYCLNASTMGMHMHMRARVGMEVHMADIETFSKVF